MNISSPSASFQPVRLLLLGFGHVAQAFLPLLAARNEWLAEHLAIHPLMSGIGTRSQGFYVHPRGLDAVLLANESNPVSRFEREGERLEDSRAFIQAGQAAGASLLIELTTLNPHNGQPALDHIRTALQSGMDVVTANKGPVAYAQEELQALARRNNVQFRFEATVMDGLPLFNLAQFSLPAVGFQAFRALLNTTSSLILSMIERGHSREEAILEAQRLGIAEADPWHDLDGWDAVMKTTILANTLLGGQLTPPMVKRTGIGDLTLDEIRAAAKAGSPIRLVSSAKSRQGILTAEVLPRTISIDDILRVGTGSTSVIALETEAMGTITLVEHEPTTVQTAYGVLSDLITVLRQRGTVSS